jgi:hypothetical protein
MPITSPSSPIKGLEGSQSHHWLPWPSQVPVFRRTEFLTSTLCLIFLCSP